ncbi:Putative S-adenosylmethionine-dependent methyltransferase Bmt2 [Septoria linicola]|uniref:25S rRNA adenine-N(1) methyltransferase n=1 Tax=Septoria linicola TaxID=215465 RepID=A0A9Q9AM60_9PEZI|nr:putative S-adenosylmethionine-dependent methyltransferase Bmt2 [Septoria linicola]USW51530.1 Putative S-adenosylmethionine-dependent methyltransferase Bmt2 [Septoria linicola]
MGVQKKSHKANASLKAGRPPTVKPSGKKTMSSKATQKTIVTFHQLQKLLAAAKAKRDAKRASEIESQMEELGGIKAYQEASIQGQSADRGGDSSLVLMKWLGPIKQDLGSLDQKFKMLEVGALSTKNACSKSGCFNITHIDLNSQAPGILQQDFMDRPLPSLTSLEAEDDKFDMISLSLVLNFAPSAPGRGEMLRRTTKFLRQRQVEADIPGSPSSSQTLSSSPSRTSTSGALPASLTDYRSTLFLVLPSSCVLNSRYFNDERLTLIMASLGYALLQRKKTSKLVYYLWQLRDKPAPAKEQKFGKVKVRDGGGMNNFWVELRPEE